MVIFGWLMAYFMVGNLVADRLPAALPATHVVYSADGEKFSTPCRPYCYDKVAWRPWPFRRGRWVACPHEGDSDSCTNEVFQHGAWREPRP